MKNYLIGSMDSANDGGVGWRQEMAIWLQKRGVFVLNPCNKPTKDSRNEFAGREDITRMKEEGRFDEIRPKYAEDIRGFDLRCVDEASFLVWYFDLDIPTCGSYEEFFTANKSKKPTVICCKQGKKFLPHWLWLCQPANFMFSDWDSLKAYLDYVDSHPGDVETHRRWKFMDWDKLVKPTYDLYDFAKQI